ncbi:MAG: ABC transporter ATP-binding protein [Verrucomicrobia bacterium]|nr:ABC transporter ATP-binding protein [Verrucomicrobiota bacterium]
MKDGNIVEVEDLYVRFSRDEGILKPINGFSFNIPAGSSIGVVGESGCGKTMTAYSLLRILPRGGQITHGSMRLRRKNGEVVDLAQLDADGEKMRHIRGGDVAMIFQEPMTAFSPVHTLYDQIAEVLEIHSDLSDQDIRKRVVELFDLVGIPDPESRVDAYAFEFSGGMRQRAMIAMALASEPALLIADEPTTALDVTVQAQVLRLIKKMQRKFNIALMLITHDLGVIAHMVDYVYVMYMGEVVEAAPVAELFKNPLHPYTRDLLNSVPKMTGPKQELAHIKGSVPSSAALPPGCMFHPRCTRRVGEVCWTGEPALVEMNKNHYVRCFIHSPETSGMSRHAEETEYDA